MLPKKQRVSTRLFSEINKGSKKIDTPLFLLKARFVPQGQISKFSCVVSKKVSKSAVSRNRIRRVFYSAIKNSLPKQAKGVVFVFYLKSEALQAKQKDFEKEIRNVFNKFFIESSVLRKTNNTV